MKQVFKDEYEKWDMAGLTSEKSAYTINCTHRDGTLVEGKIGVYIKGGNGTSKCILHAEYTPKKEKLYAAEDVDLETTLSNLKTAYLTPSEGLYDFLALLYGEEKDKKVVLDTCLLHNAARVTR